jgi:aminopeptidase N
MENWGLVMYRTTSVLFDEGSSDSSYKNYIAYVVAHGQLRFQNDSQPS